MKKGSRKEGLYEVGRIEATLLIEVGDGEGFATNVRLNLYDNT
jgi:hypothetical protein